MPCRDRDASDPHVLVVQEECRSRLGGRDAELASIRGEAALGAYLRQLADGAPNADPGLGAVLRCRRFQDRCGGFSSLEA
jgi:hypothetical protein